MPVLKCTNGKWRIGTGDCIYQTKKAAENAYLGYLGAKFGKEIGKMPTQLKNIAISFISLVKKGANDRKLIIKSSDKKPTLEFTSPITKIDEDHRRFYSIVYPANEIDQQGEFATKEDIEKASYDFMRNLRLLNIDKNHSEVSEDAFVAESWLIKKGDPIFPDDPEGSWAVGIIVEDDETWDQVKKGEIEAISMGGTGDKILDQEIKKHQFSYHSRKHISDSCSLCETRENLTAHHKNGNPEDNVADNIQTLCTDCHKTMHDMIGRAIVDKDDSLIKVDESIIIKAVRNALTKIRKKGGDDMKEKETQELIDKAIENAVEDLPKPLTKEDMAVIVGEAIKPLTERVEKVEKTSKGSKQSKDEITPDEDLEKTGAEIAKMINEQKK